MFTIPLNAPSTDAPPRKPRNQVGWDRMRSHTFRRQTFTARLIRDMERIEEPAKWPALDIWEGDGLFLYGKAGYGKTLYAAFLAERIAQELWINYHTRSVEFIPVPDLFIKLKKSFSDPESEDWQVMEKYTDAWLLVLDDFGAGAKPSEWLLENLYYLINYRYENLLPTIITSNLNLNDLATMYGDIRITSRIQRMCRISEKADWKE